MALALGGREVAIAVDGSREALQRPVTGGAWQLATERAFALAFAGWVALLLVISGPDTLRAAERGWFESATIVASVAVLAATAWLIWTIGPTPAVAAIVTPVAVVIHIIAACHDNGPPYGIHWWAVQLTLPFGGLLAGSLPLRAAVGWVTVLLGAETFVLVRAGVPTAELLWWICLMAVVSALVGSSVLTLRRTAAAADRAAAQTLATFAQREQLVAAGQVEREITRRLHDDVAHALRACSLPARALSPSALTDHCRAALRSLEGSSGRTGRRAVAQAIRELAQRLPVPVELSLSADPTLPPQVADGIVGIVGETFRNIERHAGQCRVRVSTHGDDRGALTVQVADDGRGFDTNRSGFGLTASVRQRAADIGARVSVISAVGRGTEVTLQWAAESAEFVPQSHDDLAEGAGTRRRLVYGTLLPTVLGSIVLVLTRPLRLVEPASAVITIGCMAVCPAVVLLAGRRSPSRGVSIAIMICAPLALLIESVPWGFRADIADWALPGIVVPLFALLAFYRPVRETLPGLLVMLATVLAISGRTDPSLGREIATLAQTALPYLAALTVRLLLDRAGPVVARTTAARTELIADQQRENALRLVGDQRLQRIKVQVQPYLHRVVRRHGLISDSDRGRAMVLEAAVRDDLALGASLDKQTRLLIEQCRMRGVSVQFNLADPPTAGTLSDLVSAAVQDLDPDSPRQRLVFSRSREQELTCLIDPARPAGGAARIAAEGGRIRATGRISLYSLPPVSPDQRTTATQGAPIG